MTVTEIFSLVVYALDAIKKLVKDPALSEADDLAHAIAGIFDAVDNAVVGEVTPEIAQAQIRGLIEAIKSNDAAADKALDAKFPSSR